MVTLLISSASTSSAIELGALGPISWFLDFIYNRSRQDVGPSRKGIVMVLGGLFWLQLTFLVRMYARFQLPFILIFMVLLVNVIVVPILDL